MTTPMSERVREYWNVQPPHKADENAEKHDLKWYQSISEHRWKVVPYYWDFVGFDSYAGKKILEIGCGAGTDACEFARHGADVTAIDITDHAIELTTKRAEVEGLNIKAMKYDGDRLPFDPDTFDVVYSCGVLHHSPFMDDLFADTHKVLKPGGELVMMLYHRNSAIYYYSIVARNILRGTVDGRSRDELLSNFSEFREGCPMTRAFTVEEIKERLWFYDKVDSFTDYPVYDEDGHDRKKPLVEPFNLPATGVHDVDEFMHRMDADIAAGNDLRKYGWHLLVRANK